jgi:hypothetical protein
VLEIIVFRRLIDAFTEFMGLVSSPLKLYDIIPYAPDRVFIYAEKRKFVLGCMLTGVIILLNLICILLFEGIIVF